MIKKILPSMVIIIALSALSSCKSLGLGASDTDKELVGKRIAVLEAKTALQADSSIASIPIELPKPELNASWFRTHGYQPQESANLALSGNPHETGYRVVRNMHGEYPMTAGPVVTDAMLYTLDEKGIVTAFDRVNSKKIIWTYAIKMKEKSEAKEPFSNAGITYDNGAVYVVTGKNTVLALQASDGKLLWSRSVNSMVRSAPAVGNDMLFVTTMDNHLYALNIKDGSIVWIHAGLTADVSVLGAASPIFVRNIVIVSYSSGEIFALNAMNGNELWSDSVSQQNNKTLFTLSDINVSPVIYKNLVITASQEGVLGAWDIQGGLKIWQQPLAVSDSPWVAGDFAYVLTQDSQVLCLHLPTGAIRWVSQLPAYKNEKDKKNPYEWHGPVMAGGSLWIVGAHGQLATVSAEDGKIIRQEPVAKNIRVSPVIAQETMFLLGSHGNLMELK